MFIESVKEYLESRIDFWLSSCGICSDLSGLDLICFSCLKGMKPQLRITKRREEFCHAHFFLFVWEEGDKRLTRLAQVQKGGRRSLVSYEDLLGDVSRNLLRSFDDPSKLVIVPAPASKARLRDHAQILSEALGGLMGIPVVYALRRLDEGLQKNRSKQERATLKYESTSKIVGRQVLFVDDILTSGSSFRACREALGIENKYQCFTLLFRPLKTLQSGPLSGD